MKYATYEEWKGIGFQVQAGERSRKKNSKGIALFSDDQVLDINETDAYDEIMEESMGGGFNDDWSGW